MSEQKPRFPARSLPPGRGGGPGPTPSTLLSAQPFSSSSAASCSAWCIAMRLVEELVQLAVHYFGELVQSQVDAVIRYPALRESCRCGCARTGRRCRPAAAATGRVPHYGARAPGRAAGPSATPSARARFLCCERSSWHSTTSPLGKMSEADRGVGLVDVLSAGAGGSKGVHPQVLGVQFHLARPFNLRQHRHRAGRGVDASLRLRHRHPLHAVCAGFELETGVGPPGRRPAPRPPCSLPARPCFR